LNSCEKGSLNTLLRILYGLKRVFSVSLGIFVEVVSVSILRLFNYINGNFLISKGFFLSSSNFGVFGDHGDFEYFDLNFLVIFGDSDLIVEGEFFGVFISFSSKLFLKINICSILFPTLLIFIGIGSKIIV